MYRRMRNHTGGHRRRPDRDPTDVRSESNRTARVRLSMSARCRPLLNVGSRSLCAYRKWSEWSCTLCALLRCERSDTAADSDCWQCLCLSVRARSLCVRCRRLSSVFRCAFHVVHALVLAAFTWLVWLSSWDWSIGHVRRASWCWNNWVIARQLILEFWEPFLKSLLDKFVMRLHCFALWICKSIQEVEMTGELVIIPV